MKLTYFGDFETTTINENNEVKVYLWVLLRGKRVYQGTTIESFMEKLMSMSDSIIYFHNLKFDFSYIHYYLIKNDIDYSICEKKGTIYNVKINNVELRDSMNFMPMSLREVGEKYCEVYHKTSIDYEVDYDHVATQEEIDYCINDCRVLEEGLTNYIKTIEQVLIEANCQHTISRINRRLTNAGIAFDAFKELSDFDKCCPKTTQVEYELLKGAYKGGYVYSNPQGIVKDVQMIDCNSMYPFIYSTIEMPYGKPITCLSFEDVSRFKFYVVGILIKYELKEGYIPIIGGGVGKYGGINYRSSSNGEYEELVVCSTDLNLIREFYDCEIEFLWGKGFETKPYFFKEYADIFIKFKNKYKGIQRAVAKVFLNSPYGKTAMNGMNEIKGYKIDEEGVSSYVRGYEIDDHAYQYLPMAIAITAGARNLLLTTAKKIGFKNVYYMDTDSIKFKYKETGIAYNDNVLGDWKDEGRCSLFKTISPKKYVYYHDHRLYYTCAGFSKSVLESEMHHTRRMNKDEAIHYMNLFDTGLELECLQSKVVVGGRALIPIKKKIK